MATERATDTLRPHPLNEQVYGNEQTDQSLRESIAQDGIITPLVIDQHGTILAGHRRWRAAQAAGLPSIPVVVREIADPLDGERILIESNRQREKTTTQRQREADALVRIIGEQARQRMAEGRRRGGQIAGRGRPRDEVDRSTSNCAEAYQDDLPPAPKRVETDAQVAEMVGVKRDTYRRERHVYQVAEGQREAPPEAQEIARNTLAKLDAKQITPFAAERKVRAAEEAAKRGGEQATSDALVTAIDDGSIARAELRATFFRVKESVNRQLLALDAGAVAATLGEADEHRARQFIADVMAWAAQLEAAMPRHLRVVGSERG